LGAGGDALRCLSCWSCLQVDTRDVLFVVGGAFVHLEKLLMDSRHKSSIGFGNKVRWRWRVFVLAQLVASKRTAV
jgi:ATP-dependent Clp protease ATP-binding subunit ClpX